MTGRVVQVVEAGQSLPLLVQLDEVSVPDVVGAPVVWVGREWRQLV